MGKKQSDFFKIPKYNGCGIYAIICWEDFKCYIGSSKNINRRAGQHKRKLIRGEHENKSLQSAYNDGKILRFVILSKLSNDLSNDILINLEYLYMLQMLYKTFSLYNKNPMSKNFQGSEVQQLLVSIACGFSSIVSASDNIENALKKEYGSNSGYMRNTKYREWSAKHQSTV